MKLIQSEPTIIRIRTNNKQESFVHGCDDSKKYSVNVTEDKLNESKNALDKYYMGDVDQETQKRISIITRSCDLYRGLVTDLAREKDYQNVTNAWTKFYELYTLVSDIINIPVIPQTTSGLRIFCNAELPGASICALNHYMKSHRIRYAWKASSFMPDNTGTQLGDQYGLLRGNPENWLIHDANEFNGDMTDLNMIKKCAEKCLSAFPLGVNVYTHDAGIDVTRDFGPWKAYIDQERANMKLHLGCALAGLMTMSAGATFIAKQYTCFEGTSRFLIDKYATLFDKFYLIKPMTSRPYNSEIYLVGIGYMGNTEEASLRIINELSDMMTKSEMEIIAMHKDTYVDNTDDIMVATQCIFGRQIAYLNELIEYIENNGIAVLPSDLSSTWRARTKIRPIDKRSFLKQVYTKKYRK